MNLLQGTVGGLSILKDPFAQQYLEGVLLRAWRGHDGKFNFYAKVEFKNDDTKGEQQINATSFDDLIRQTEAFLKTLEAKSKT